MADLFRKAKSVYSSTTNTFSTGTGVTITPTSVAGLPTDTEITLTFDRVNSAGDENPSGQVECIIGTISGGNFVVRTSPSTGRGADSTTEQGHTSPVVEYLPNAKDINDMVDGILVEHDQDGTHDTAIVAKLTSTQTLTNKRVTPRIVTTTDDATAVIDTDNTDQYQLTAVANATTFTVTGSPTAGQKLIVRLKDAGVAKGLTWTGFTSKGATLPTTTVAGKTHYIGLIYNLTDATWDCVAAIVEA